MWLFAREVTTKITQIIQWYDREDYNGQRNRINTVKHLCTKNKNVEIGERKPETHNPCQWLLYEAQHK
jgi:hypothetical protein